MVQETGGPKVNVLLSLYRPDPGYLEEQLCSIKGQDWPDLEVVCYNDCPDDPVDRSAIEAALAPVPVRFLPGGTESLGYVGAFEKLTRASDGDFVFFCDQDDVWDPGKISTMVRALEEDGSLLAVCDYRTIDGTGNVISPTVRHQGSRRFIDTWDTGDDVVAHDVFQCLAPGMVLGMRGPFARSIVPFSRRTGHDKWAIACAGIEGVVSYVPETLASYRRHGANVTGALQGVDTKADYRAKRCADHDGVIDDLEARYGDVAALKEAREFSRARLAGNVVGIWRHRDLAPDQARFETVLALVPSPLFPVLKKAVRRVAP
ncbi:glycosyltransferase [Caniella muris]|uniref:glycosyltransferase n=1 Tax=Caniella muris TaxID=2941502 RepID=UPI002040378C|nr:glycosyltransferase [Caniella muris]